MVNAGFECDITGKVLWGSVRHGLEENILDNWITQHMQLFTTVRSSPGFNSPRRSDLFYKNSQEKAIQTVHSTYITYGNETSNPTLNLFGMSCIFPVSWGRGVIICPVQFLRSTKFSYARTVVLSTSRMRLVTHFRNYWRD